MRDTQKDKENEMWRRGYDMGVKTALQKNDTAIRIGQAIITALDERYESAKEDY